MFKKHTRAQWLFFCMVLAMLVVLFWLAAPWLKPLGNLNLVIFFVGVVGFCVYAGVPIAFAFGLATFGYLALTTRTPLMVLVGRMDEGMSHLILLAVPLFVFLGLLIEMTGMARAMVAFLASLLAISALAGIPNFVFIQWVAPLVSEFPEMASTVYFARTVDGAPMALMNMVSSNINQWTLLVGSLPVAHVLGGGGLSLVLDSRQIEEVLLASDWCGGHFLIELTREGRLDEMTVLAEARPESWDDTGLAEQADLIAQYIKNTIGISARVKAVAPETLERSLGKAKRVIDKRPKG